MNANWVDVVLILVVVAGLASGWYRGFLVGLLDLVRWVGSWLAALFLYQTLAAWLGQITDWTDTWRLPIAFLLVLFIAGIAIQAAGAALLRRVRREHHEGQANRALGLIPGLASGLIMAALLSALLTAMPFADGLSRSVQKSALADRFAAYTDDLESILDPVFGPAVREGLNRFTTTRQPGSDEFIELPFKVANTEPVPTLEAQMLELVNQERTLRGLKPLEADPELTEVARRHSADMFARGYFSHHSPEGKDPFDRMRESNVRFRTAGENLAIAPTLQMAHDGLMRSPGHRANILRPAFGRVGIGIMSGGRRGIMVSQEFRD
jgi:uncharacterized protein YkwD/uncharacterized membrane protein required for colicin V production